MYLSIKLFLGILLISYTHCTKKEPYKKIKRVPYPKDMGLDIHTFPPQVKRADGGLVGHLGYLGAQCHSSGQIKEETYKLKPEEFWDNYITKSIPIKIPDLVSMSSAIEEWNDIYLSNEYGHLMVEYTTLKQHMWENKTAIKLSEFLKLYRSENFYMRVILPEIMQKETPMPHLINCGPYINNTKHDETFILPKIVQLVEPFFWISAGDTSSLLLSHPEHNFHCVLDGRMDFIFVPTTQFELRKEKDWRDKLGVKETFRFSGEWTSEIDVDMVNAHKYKRLRTTKWYWSTLRAGDCIYIPAGYFHQIRSYGRCVSTSVYFSALKQPNPEFFNVLKSSLFEKCPKSGSTFEPMDQTNKNFLWAYENGHRHLKQKNFEPNDLRNLLVYLMRDRVSLHYNQFNKFYKEIMSGIVMDDLHGHDILKQLKSIDVWKDFFLPMVLKPDPDLLVFARINDLKYPENLGRFEEILNGVQNIGTRNKRIKHDL